MTSPAQPAIDLSLPQLRQRLRDARAQLNEGYLAAPDPRRYLRAHSRLVDHTVRSLWAVCALPADCTLLAVGGYGRGELFPSSDVDLLILLPDKVTDAQEERIATFVRSLWDIGVELGHSVRTIADCTEEARRDITVATALLESRRLAGSRTLCEAFNRQVGRGGIDADTFVRAKRLEQAQRHEKFHNTPFSLEPNLKEAPGALRDIHVVRWVCRAMQIGDRWAELATHGLLTPTEARRLGWLERYLSDIRIRLHLLARRREDRLLFDYQHAIAQQLGWQADGARRASERFMQRYYRAVKSISQLNTIVLQNMAASAGGAVANAAPPRVLDEHFQVLHDLLDARDEDVFQRHPGAILESFRWLQRDSSLIGMSARTLRGLWRSRLGVNREFRTSAANRACFLELLQSHRGIVHELRRMNQYGILGRYIPAFGRIVGQMQHDLFHVYTVDQHILMVVRNVRRFTMPEFSHEYPECSRLIANLDRAWLLYVAALFHDIAKGRGGDHSKLGRADAQRFCRSHGLSREDTQLVVFLVEHHLTMSSVAQKADLTDPEVIGTFARLVGDRRHLTALYLLTVADIRGTSPKVWNAWKAKLLEDLYRLTLRHLDHGKPEFDRDIEHKQAEALRVLRLHAIDDTAKDALWQQLDVGYFLRHDAAEIAWHARVLHDKVDTTGAVVKTRLAPLGEGIQVLVYTRDQRDLFARLCGCFEAMRLSIIEAKIHTTRHGYALDSFYVLSDESDTAHRDLMSLTEHELTNALASRRGLPAPLRGRVSRQLTHFPIEPQVGLQPDEKGRYWSLSVIAGDRPGLLYAISRVFAKFGINLHNARVNTLGERAEDVFLIDGEILYNPKVMLSLETDLIETMR
jgi:[protein-PII] uridylyltransferase